MAIRDVPSDSYRRARRERGFDGLVVVGPERKLQGCRHLCAPRDLVDGLLSNRHLGITLDEDLVASASGRIIPPGECESCPVTGLRGVPVSVSVLVPEGAELESDA